jgi:hypothetical protein
VKPCEARRAREAREAGGAAMTDRMPEA